MGGAASGFKEFGFRESGTQEPFILFPLILPVGTSGFLEETLILNCHPFHPHRDSSGLAILYSFSKKSHVIVVVSHAKPSVSLRTVSCFLRYSWSAGNIHAGGSVCRVIFKGTYSHMNGLLKHWQVHLMWCYIIAIWQVKMHLHLWYTRGRASTLCSCLSEGLSKKVGVRETWPGSLVIEMHVLSCQIQQTNIYSFHLNSFWQLRAPSTTNNTHTTNSFDGHSTADQSKSMCQQMPSTVTVSLGLWRILHWAFFFVGRELWNRPSSLSWEDSSLISLPFSYFFSCVSLKGQPLFPISLLSLYAVITGFFSMCADLSSGEMGSKGTKVSE